jgi:hypothetical protein
MVEVQEEATLSTSKDYDAVCKTFGLRGYNPASSNTANCPDIGGTGPTITNNCNIGSMWGSFVTTEALPHMARAVWIAITRTHAANDLGIEWNEAGPCDADTQATLCGRGAGTSRGLDHGLNPIYGENYDVKNYQIEPGQYIACAVQND